MILDKDNSPGIFDKPARQQASNSLKKDEVRVAASESRSLQFRCAKYLVSSGLDDVIEGTFVLLSLAMVILYALQTYYTQGTPQPVKICELVFTCLFIAEYLIRFYTSEKRLSFFFSINSIISVVILIPTFLYRSNLITEPTSYPLKIFVLLKVLFIFGLYRMEKILARRGIEVGRKLWRLLVSLLSILIIFAALVQEADNHSTHIITNADGTPIERRQFHEELYFLIITMATVGFGDLQPASELSRLFIFVVIFAILAVVPVQFQDYFKAVSLTSKFTRISYKKPKKAKHILLLGDFTHVALKTFLNELYHTDHGVTETHTVILLEKPPSEVLTNNITKQHKGKVFLLGGSAFNKGDLKRCLAQQSVCVVILANKLYNTPLQQDYRNIMMAMAVKKYGFMHQKDIRLCVQLIRPQHKNLYNPGKGSQNTGKFDQVVCIDEIKLHLLAKSCTCQGIITLISLLITSDVPSSEGYEGWEYQYLQGAQNELYRVQIHGSPFQGQRFKDVVLSLYERSKMILVALELKIGKHTKVFVNPYDYIFENRTYYIYVIYQNYPSMEKIYGDQMNQFLLQMEHGKDKTGKITDEIMDPLQDSKLHFTDAQSQTQKLIMLQDKRGLEDAKNDNVIRLSNNRKLVYDDVTISNCNALDKHVILCNIFPGIENFIGTLRSKSLGASRPQIVLFSNETQPSIWQQINMFEEVYIMKGSALNPSDLENCGLSRARAIVVLSRSSDRVSNLSEEFMDADAIFMYKTIRNCDPSVLIIIELNNLSTISFIWQRPLRNPKHNSSNNNAIGAKKPKLDASSLQNPHHQVMQEVTVVGSGQRNIHILNNPFAAGEIYFSQLLDTLMCQAYYNPFITELLRQFVKGAAPCNPAYQKIYKRLSLTECSLHLIPVPNAKDQTSWEFKDLFTRCIQNRIILLGVFKNGNKVPGTVAIPNNRVEKRFSEDEKQCVIINSPTYIVKPADKLYVLSDLKPEELEIFSLDSEKRLRNYRNKNNDLNSLKAKKFKVAQGPEGILDLEYSNQINQMNETLHQIQESIHLMKKDMQIHTNSAREMLSHKLNVMAKEGHRRLGKK